MSSTRFSAPAATRTWWGVLDSYKYWIILAVVVLVIGGTIYYFYDQGQKRDKQMQEALADAHVRADAYARRRSDQMATDKAKALLEEYKKQPGARHSMGDPGILPDLGSVSDWETNASQRASPADVAITTIVNQLGSTAPPPIDGPGSVSLQPADTQPDYADAVSATPTL